jgi:hypothetical protein
MTEACRNRSLLHKRKIGLPVLRELDDPPPDAMLPCNLKGEHDG